MKIISKAGIWGLATNFVVIFIIAALSSGHELIITVNEYHEMIPEFAMFVVMWTLGTFYLFKRGR